MKKDTRSIRVNADVYDAVRAVAADQRRSLASQLTIVVEAGLEALGHADALAQARSFVPMDGEVSLPNPEGEQW